MRARFDTLVFHLQAAFSTDDFNKIYQTYEDFFRYTSRLSESSFSPRERQRSVLLNSLATLAKHTDASSLLERVINFLHVHCSMPLDLHAHNTVLRVLQEQGMFRVSLEWLLRMKDGPGRCSPPAELWATLLKKCRRGEVPKRLFDAPLVVIRESGCAPNELIYRTVLDMLFNDPSVTPKFFVVHNVIREMHACGVLEDNKLAYIVGIYTKAKSFQAIFELERMRKDLPEGPSKLATEMDNSLEQAIELGAPQREVLRIYNSFLRKGFQPTATTLETLAQGISTATSMIKWEERTGIRATEEVWTIVIDNAIHNVRNAVEVYETAVARGQQPTVAMLHPILRAICSQKWRPPSAASLDKALSLHRQYVHLREESMKGMHSRSHQVQGDLPLYNTLLRALTSSEGRPENLQTALSLLEELQSRGIAMDNMTRTSFIILTMHAAQDAQEGLEVYRSVRQSTDGAVLDQKGFVAVLAAYAKLFLTHPSSLGSCLEILKDMRSSGHHITAEVFTILLRHLGRLGGVETSGTLVAAIRRIHNHITVEASLVPDIVLWNQLMDTYQRVGCFSDAYRVWSSIYISGQYDNASVSIIFDACSFAGSLDAARDIYNKLHHSGFRFNHRNWSNFIECLCRLGRFEDATHVLCVTMPQHDVGPTTEMVKLLLQFVSGREEQWLVHSRLKEYLPKLYAYAHGADQEPKS